MSIISHIAYLEENDTCAVVYQDGSLKTGISIHKYPEHVMEYQKRSSDDMETNDGQKLIRSCKYRKESGYMYPARKILCEVKCPPPRGRRLYTQKEETCKWFKVLFEDYKRTWVVPEIDICPSLLREHKNQ